MPARDEIVTNTVGYPLPSLHDMGSVRRTKEVTHMSDSTSTPAGAGRTPDELVQQVRFLEAEVGDLRRRLTEAPGSSRGIELRLADTQRSLAAVTSQNERLAQTLREARDQIMKLKEEVDRLAQPPAGFGTFLSRNDDDSVDVFTGGRKLRVNVSPAVDLDELVKGQEVMLNEALNVVAALDFEKVGEVVMFKELLEDGERGLVIANADEERVVRLAKPLFDEPLRAGDSLLLDARAGYAYERVPKSEVEELVLEEVPDIDYSRIGGLITQIDAIRDAVELPYLHPELFKEHQLKPPKGVLLYGPPGCGKTLIAKAVANSLAKKVSEKTGASGKSYFLNIKGPELLNKYVGETERHIRLVFQRAREKASMGTPVIVFFDEMDSLFRTRGSGVSSDVENTIVPQLLSEIDGVELLENVLVIGASNREDMIDPAILRPGRLDVKIKIERPDAESARDIFSKYLTADLPLHGDDLAEFGGDREACVAGMIRATVERMYSESEDNRFLEVTYANGDKEVLYFKDFNSGAMIQNIVDRAKKMAIKDFLDHEQRGLRVQHMLQACVDEFKENEDLPNTTNPDDWARISGKKGERIVFIRTLITGKQGTEPGRSIDTVANTGQYL
jgi:proteasome-associated ATPase